VRSRCPIPRIAASPRSASATRRFVRRHAPPTLEDRDQPQAAFDLLGLVREHLVQVSQGQQVGNDQAESNESLNHHSSAGYSSPTPYDCIRNRLTRDRSLLRAGLVNTTCSRLFWTVLVDPTGSPLHLGLRNGALAGRRWSFALLPTRRLICLLGHVYVTHQGLDRTLHHFLYNTVHRIHDV
jgi:hypothetical protein